MIFYDSEMLKHDFRCICFLLILIELINWFLGEWKYLAKDRKTKRYSDSDYELMFFSDEETYDKEASDKE